MRSIFYIRIRILYLLSPEAIEQLNPLVFKTKNNDTEESLLLKNVNVLNVTKHEDTAASLLLIVSPQIFCLPLIGLLSTVNL